MSRTIQDSAVDLLWSLWSELGVPGVVRNHQLVAIDPEPLIVVTPALVGDEPRLKELVLGWCVANQDRVSSTRLQGLAEAASVPTRNAFWSMAATLRDQKAVRWPVPSGVEPWPASAQVRATTPDLTRPSLVRLRMRALCGVGARADTMCELLAREAGWTTAADLQDEGYSKRNIARILADLEHAGLATGLHAKGPALRFRLARNEPLRALVAGTDVAFPRWRQILGFVSAAVEFSGVEGPSATTRRVVAHNLAEAMRPITEQLWIDAPPTTRGNPNAAEAVQEWLRKELLSLATGTSPAFGVEAVKAAELPGGGEAWIWLSARAPGHDRVAAVLRTPRVPGAQFAAAVPAEDGWTAYQLIFEPRLPSVAIRNTVEHLVFPLKVVWRSAGTGT